MRSLELCTDFSLSTPPSPSSAAAAKSRTVSHCGTSFPGCLDIVAVKRRCVLRGRYTNDSTAILPTLRPFDDIRHEVATAVSTGQRHCGSVASVSAGTDLLRHCHLNDLRRIDVES